MNRLEQLTSQIEEREKLVSVALKAAEIGVWCWYYSDNKLLWDKGMYDLFCITNEEFNESLASFEHQVHPEDLPIVRERLGFCLAEGIPYDCNYRVKLPNGNWRMIKGHGNITLDKAGKKVMAGICIQLNNGAVPSVSVPKESLRVSQ